MLYSVSQPLDLRGRGGKTGYVAHMKYETGSNAKKKQQELSRSAKF